jgi:hypothetical protein
MPHHIHTILHHGPKSHSSHHHHSSTTATGSSSSDDKKYIGTESDAFKLAERRGLMRAANDIHTENIAARKKAENDAAINNREAILTYKYGPRWDNEYRGGKTRRTKKQS